jgi:hypothetical protein
MGITGGLVKVAEAVEYLADSVRESRPQIPGEPPEEEESDE